MSNSSLLDLNKKRLLDGEPNFLELSPKSPSQMKAETLQQTSQIKSQELSNTSQSKASQYATPEQTIAERNANKERVLSTLGSAEYRQLADSLATDFTSDVLAKGLQQRGYSADDANLIVDELQLYNLKKAQRNIDPERVTDRPSNSMVGDLALSFLQGVQDNAIKPAIEGMRRSLTIPEAPQKGKFPDLTLSAMDSAKGFTAAIFGKEAEEGNAKVNKFFNDALIEQQDNAKILESAKSISTKVSTAAKEQMVAEFEATAKNKYPNGFVRAAAGVLKGMESFAANPRVLATETAKQAPNLISGGLFGSLSKKILTRGKTQEEAQRWLQNEGKEQAEALSKRIGVSTVALQEGMSNGVEAKLDVLNTSIADLESNSPEYKKLIDKNYSPEQARNILSDTAFDWAFGISATVGAVTSLGLGTGKLNANSFRGTNPVTATGKEMTEELIQSGSGAFAGNVAALKTTDPDRELDKGVGVAAGQGAILGGTTAGGMSTVGAVLDGTVADVAGSVANTVGTKLDVVFNGSGNKFTKENIKHVSSGDYSKLTGDTIDEKIESVLSTAAMKPFKNDHVKIGGHINKLLEVIDAEFTAKESELPADATDQDKLDLINKYAPAQDKLLKMIDSINAQVVLQRTPLPEDATDEQKAERILTFGSMRPQEDSEFDELNNLANSPNITSDQKDALTSLAEVRQTLSELRSSGGVKGMTVVAKDVLEGTTLDNGSKKDNWRGIQTYVNNILGAIQANVPKAAEFELKQMTRFRNQRSLKYQLAKAYVEANTVEGRKAAGEAYINAFGKSSPELMDRAKRGEALVVPKLFKQLEFEYNAMESALAGMANVYKATSKMRATEAVESAFAANTPATVAPAVTTPTATAEAVPTATVTPLEQSPVTSVVQEPVVTQPQQAAVQDPVQEAVSPEFKADSFEYTPPPVVPEIEAIQTADKAAGNTIAPEIVDEVEVDDSAAPVVEETATEDKEPVKDEQPETEATDKTTTDTAEKAGETATETRTKRARIDATEKAQRVEALRNEPTTPKGIKDAIDEAKTKGKTISDDTLIRGEKAVARAKEKAETKAKEKAAREEAAAKVTEFKDKAYPRIMEAFMFLKDMTREDAKTMTKNLVAKWKLKLADNSVGAVLSGVDAYVTGLKESATLSEPREGSGKIYMLGYNTGKSINASVARGKIFIQGNLKSKKREELSKLLVAVKGLEPLEFMKAADPLQYVLDYLDKGKPAATNEILSQKELEDHQIKENAAESAKKFFIEFFNTFEATYESNTSKGSRYKDPSWAAFDKELVQLFRKEEDGKYPVVFKVAMAVQALQMLNNLPSYDHASRKEVASRLGMGGEFLITDEGFKEGLKLGNTLNNEIEALGSSILNFIGIKPNTSFDNNTVQTLVGSTGQLAFVVLENMGVVQVNYATVEQLDSWKKKYKGEQSKIEEREKVFSSTGLEITTGKVPFVTIKKVPRQYASEDYVTSGDDNITVMATSDKAAEYSTFSQATNVSKALEEMFELNPAARIPTTTEPTMDDVPKYFSGTKQSVPEEQRQAYLSQMKRQWQSKRATSFLFEEYLTDTQAAQVAGAAIDFTAFPKYLRAKMEAKTRALIQEIKQTRAAVRTLGDQPFYMHLDAWRIGRTGYLNTLLNPQASKFARHIMSMKDWVRPVDMNNEKQAELFKVALAFNFGITIDKRNNVSEVIQKLEELTSKAEFEELLWAYNEMKDASDNQNNPDYEPTGNDALAVKTFMELMTSEALWGKGATSSWSKVEALAEYAAMVKADGKPFTTSLMVEIDGITNGVLIANILFGINDPQVLAKSGVFIKNSGITDVNGNPIEDYVEWTKDKGNTDSYQTLAKYTYEQFRSIFADIADKGRRLNTASLQEGEMPLTDDEKKSLQERLGLPKKYALTQKGVKLRLQQFNAAMAIVGTPLTMEGLISKAWRDLMKPPLMVTNYGAGINSVIENMLETIIETMHVEIGNANKGDKEYNRALDIIAALNVMMPKTPVTLPANPLDFEMSLEQIVALERFLKMAVGTPLDVALKTNYTAYNNRRDYINAVVNTHEQLGFNKIEARIKEWKDANGSNNWPSVEWLQQQMEELKEDLSVIPTALSSDVDSGLMINKLEKFIAERLLPEDRVVVESELNSLPDGGYRNIASQLGRKVISGAGVGTLAYVVQGLDGAVAIRLLAEFAVMNAHDGFGFAYDQVVEGANAANEILIKAIQEHTFWADIRAKHQKILDHVAAVNNEEDTITMMAEEGFLLGRDLEASVNRSKSWEASRDTIISNMTVVQQYYYPGTDYRPNGKEEAVVVSEDSIDTVADLLVDEFTKELEAEDKGTMGTFGTSNTQFNPDVNTTINSTTVLPLFETVVRMDSTEETPEHLDHLRNVLNAIVVGVVGPVEFALASKDAVTAGEYNPETNKIEMRIARDSSRVNPQQSAGAVFTHEILHPVLEAALEVDSKERTMIDKVFQAVKGAFKDATEMYPENATDEEKELMNGIFDYVFNNTEKVRRGRGTNAAGFTVDNTGNNYLSEFVNYALTDRLFMKMIDNPKVLKILNRPQFTPYESEGRSFLPKAMNSAVEWFISKFKQLTWVLTQKLFNVDGKLPSQMVFALAGRLAGANVNAISRMERTLKAVDKGNSKVRQAVINWVRDPILKAGRDARIKGNKGNLLFRAVVTPVRLGNAMATGVFHKAVDAAASRIDLAHDSLIASLWRDMKGATKENNLVLRIHAMSNKFVDQLRLVVRNDVVQHLRSEFKRKLTRNEKIAMNTIIVRGDLSVLVENQQSRANIIEVVGNQAKRDTLKLTLRSQLRKEYGANAGYYINMSKSLASKMAGFASKQYDTPDNANMIARIAGNSFYKASGDLLKAERIIDVLTTLEYLDLQNQTDLDAFVALAKEDERAVFNTIEYHSVTKVESFKSLFKNNKSLMRKGYLKEQFDPNVDLKYAATAEQEEELVRQGYELVGEVSQDAYDANAPVKMYRNGSAPMARNNAGAVSLQGTNAKGADIRQVNSQRGLDGELRLRNLRREIAGNHHELAGIEGHTDEVKLEPIFNEEGNVVSYRYMMSHRDKVKLLKLNENYDENLAGTAASQATKKTTEEVNTKVVEIMWDDFRDNYANEPNKFIEVSATTGDAKQREMYALLPKQMKQEAKGYFKDGRIFVRKDHYDYFFGFRKWSVTELGKKQFKNAQKSVMLDVVNTLLRQLNTPAVRNLEMGLQELAKMFKDVLVVKTGATLLANVASNLVTLALNGVNPVTMVGAHFKGWMEVTKYQKQREEVAALQLKLKTDRLLTASERRAITGEILRGKQRMSINPVRFLVEEGVYQTITEDIADADGDYSLQSRVEEWAAPVTNKIPNLVKDVGDILFMTHNTRMYKFLRNATQVSDFAARYVMHEHNMKNGMKEMDSVTKVVETFVNYDLPTHKGLQYLNDMGFILFTKYLLRTQKVILQTLQERPASVLGLMTFQYMTGMDIPDITDVSLITNPDALLFRVNDPVDSLFGVAQPHLVTGGM